MSDPTDPVLGTLVQRGNLPWSAGMDAIEAWLVPVQEVPPKAELRFYAIRGKHRERLTSDEAAAIFRDHVSKRPVTELNEAEMMIEISVLRAEVDLMRPIYAAVKVWREHRRPMAGTADAALADAFDATNKRIQ